MMDIVALRSANEAKPLVARPRYQTPEAKSGVPWFANAVIHEREKVFGLRTIDPPVTSNLVVSWYFVKRGFKNVARIIKR
jgi:hypothetical protein